MHRRRGHGAVALLVGLASLTALCWVCATQKAPAIEADIRRRVGVTLTAAGLPDIRHTVDGRAVTIRGVVGTRSTRDRAVEVVAEVDGVSGVIEDIQISLPGGRAPTPVPAADPATPTAARPDRILRSQTPPAAPTPATRPDPPTPVDTPAPAPATPTPPASAPSPAPRPSHSWTGTADLDCAGVARRIGQTHIPFPRHSAQLDASARATLQRMGAHLARCPGMLVVARGHADDASADVDDLTLSRQRADQVIAALARFDAGQARLKRTYAGAREPISPRAQDSALNRRVEFKAAEAPDR